MFKNLRTSTKLLLLCAVFVGALVVATYGLVAEKQIAIHFVRKELVGVQHLELLRGVYAALLKENLAVPPSAGGGSAAREELDKFIAAHKADSERLDTEALERTLGEAIGKIASAPDRDQKRAALIEALDAARNLASRIGDDSNLTLDPDLDSFYVQNIVVAKIPALLNEIGELKSELDLPSSAQASPETLAVHRLVLDGSIRSILEGMEKDLDASYRSANGARLRQSLEAEVDAMVSAWNAYLDAVKATPGAGDARPLDERYAEAVDSAIKAWTASLAELKGLLNSRLSSLLSRLRNSLLLNGLVAALSLAFALILGRYIVQPAHEARTSRRCSGADQGLQAPHRLREP
jgi:hypothetical protein